MGWLNRFWLWLSGLFAKKLPPAARTYWVMCERSQCNARHKVIATSFDDVRANELAKAFVARHAGHPITITNDDETDFDSWGDVTRRAS